MNGICHLDIANPIKQLSVIFRTKLPNFSWAQPLARASHPLRVRFRYLMNRSSSWASCVPSISSPIYGWVINMYWAISQMTKMLLPTQHFLPTQHNDWHGYHGHLDISEDGGSLDHWDDFVLTLSLFYSAVCVGFQKNSPSNDHTSRHSKRAFW